MNLKEVQALSDEEIRIKMAELCAWECPNCGRAECLGCDYADFPDNVAPLPTDAAAMLNTTDQLTDDQRLTFAFNLCAVVLKGDTNPTTNSNSDFRLDQLFDIAHATARQRAEALILTKVGNK